MKEHLKISKTIVLVGLMGAGKTIVGQKLATRLNIDFVDADNEIEEAAGCSISEIFTRYGEASFREGEKRVISRLLVGPAHILATGGGAFMDEETRLQISKLAISLWLKADLEILLQRVARRSHRPLLNNVNQRETLRKLIKERHPFYAQADIIINSGRTSPDITVEDAIRGLKNFTFKSKHNSPGAD
ncbi:MAG: shikimate kinase [Pseudomonadota bacterium]|nr:shikimate kinase [Pseudomonadota bacterium]